MATAGEKLASIAELLELIFLHLQVEDLVWCRQVSQKWNNIVLYTTSLQPSLYRSPSAPKEVLLWKWSKFRGIGHKIAAFDPAAHNVNLDQWTPYLHFERKESPVVASLHPLLYRDLNVPKDCRRTPNRIEVSINIRFFTELVNLCPTLKAVQLTQPPCFRVRLGEHAEPEYEYQSQTPFTFGKLCDIVLQLQDEQTRLGGSQRPVVFIRPGNIRPGYRSLYDRGQVRLCPWWENGPMKSILVTIPGFVRDREIILRRLRGLEMKGAKLKEHRERTARGMARAKARKACFPEEKCILDRMRLFQFYDAISEAND